MIDSPRILLLGADGNAGMNYAKCIKMRYPESYIIGTGYSNEHLMAMRQVGVIDDFINSVNLDNWKIIDMTLVKERLNWIHAQPEDEVEWLSNNQTELLKLGLGSGWREERVVSLTRDKFKTALTLGEDCVYWTSCYTEIFEEYKDKGQGKVWIRANRGAGSKWALPVSTAEQAANWVSYLVAEKGAKLNDFILSPMYHGPEFAVQILVGAGGKPLAIQQRQRLEYHFARQMVSGQSSTPSVARTTSDEEVYQKAMIAVDGMGNAPGIYGVDMKRGVDGVHVTEINYGRYYTTIDFFANAGINFPVIEYRYWNGSEPFAMKNIRNDVFWIRGLDREPQMLYGEDIPW